MYTFVTSQFPTAIMLAVFLLFMGVAITAKFESKMGYVFMAIAVAFGLYALRMNRIL